MKTFKQKHLILSLFIFFSHYSFYAQWVSHPNMNGSTRSGAVSWVLNDKLYVVGGGPAQDLQEYDPVSNTWTSKAAVPWSTARFLAVGFVINGNGYICTGTDGVNGIYYNDLWMYDPFANAWSPKAAFPGVGRVQGFGFSIGDNGYVGAGGDAFAFYDDMYEYSSLNDSWTPKSSFPGGIRAHVIGTSINGEGYVGAGVEYDFSISNFVDHSDLYRYTPATDTWTLATHVPGPPRLSGVSLASDTKIFAGLGGSDQNPNAGVNYSDFYSYDPVTGIWDTLPVFPIGRSESTGASILNKAYITTGRSTAVRFKDLWSIETYPLNITGIKENKINSGIRVFPTIISSELNIMIPDGTIYDLVITTTPGRKVKQIKMDKNLNLDCSDLPNGMYTLSFYSKKSGENFKIIVNR